jgi:hypothetical protein
MSVFVAVYRATFISGLKRVTVARILSQVCSAPVSEAGPSVSEAGRGRRWIVSPRTIRRNYSRACRRPLGQAPDRTLHSQGGPI